MSQLDLPDEQRQIQEILARRAAGATLRQIGTEFELSAERVRQILRRGHNKERATQMAKSAIEMGGPGSIPVQFSGLSVRAINALQNAQLLTLGDAADAYSYLNHGPAIIPNFGRTTLVEMRHLLERHSLIKSSRILSKRATEVLAKIGLIRFQEIAHQFGENGQFGANGRPPWHYDGMTRGILEEIRFFVADNDEGPKRV
jgi:hypothetical protein